MDSVGSNSNYGLGVALSLGGGRFGSYLYYTFPNYCNRPGVHFRDMTGDGRYAVLTSILVLR
jgi:hypothetical protein